MTISNKLITKGFIAAGLMNSTVLISSRFFTNTTINETDPDVMSNFGLLMIVVWGITYISVAWSFQQVKWLVGVFVIEKLIYGLIWTNWILNNSVADVYAKDAQAGTFFSIYGINDWLFCFFFLFVFIRLMKKEKA